MLTGGWLISHQTWPYPPAPPTSHVHSSPLMNPIPKKPTHPGKNVTGQLEPTSIKIYPLVNDHIAGWNIPIFNRKYIFIQGPCSIAMLVSGSVSTYYQNPMSNKTTRKKIPTKNNIIHPHLHYQPCPLANPLLNQPGMMFQRSSRL